MEGQPSQQPETPAQELARYRQQRQQFEQHQRNEAAIFADMEARLTRRAEELAARQAAHPAPVAPSPDTGYPMRRPRAVLDHLSKFGGNRAEYETWRLAAESKLMTDGEALGDLWTQFQYLYSRLEGQAQKLASPYFEAALVTRTATPQQFFAYLNTTYLDPNREARALEALRALAQGQNESFATFLPRFERLLAQAGMVLADDKTKMNYLRGTLHERMHNERMHNAMITLSGTCQ